jgi:hypothetical protein
MTSSLDGMVLRIPLAPIATSVCYMFWSIRSAVMTRTGLLDAAAERRCFAKCLRYSMTTPAPGRAKLAGSETGIREYPYPYRFLDNLIYQQIIFMENQLGDERSSRFSPASGVSSIAQLWETERLLAFLAIRQVNIKRQRH